MHFFICQCHWQSPAVVQYPPMWMETFFSGFQSRFWWAEEDATVQEDKTDNQIIFQNGDQLLKMKSTLFWLKYKNPEDLDQLGCYNIQSCQSVSSNRLFSSDIYKNSLKQRVLCRDDTDNVQGIYVPYCSRWTQEWCKKVPTWGLLSSGGHELWCTLFEIHLLLSFKIYKYQLLLWSF